MPPTRLTTGDLPLCALPVPACPLSVPYCLSSPVCQLPSPSLPLFAPSCRYFILHFSLPFPPSPPLNSCIPSPAHPPARPVPPSASINPPVARFNKRGYKIMLSLHACALVDMNSSLRSNMFTTSLTRSRTHTRTQLHACTQAAFECVWLSIVVSCLNCVLVWGLPGKREKIEMQLSVLALKYCIVFFPAA